MTNYKLQFRPKISRRAAQEMVLLFAKHGNHGWDNLPNNFRSNEDVIRFYATKGGSYEHIIEECRDYSKKVPLFENLIGSTWEITPKATGWIKDYKTGETYQKTKGPGTITMYGYWSVFEAAIEARNRAVHNMSYSDFLSAVVQGIASIEGYINYRVELCNRENPNNKLIDNRDIKISLDDKIDKWLPIMANGNKLDKGNKSWEHFRILRIIRDDGIIHPKEPSQSVSLADLAIKINLFRTGIASMLVRLHNLFSENIPAIIIRAVYSPDVELLPAES